jgi:hypothetical protein
MAQIGMFPLTEDELKAMGKELSAKVEEYDQTEADKDLTARQYNEKLKRLRGEMTHLAQVIKAEKVEREATAEEAPWQASIDEAERIANRRPGRPRRDRTGEVIEPPDEPGGEL